MTTSPRLSQTGTPEAVDTRSRPCGLPARIRVRRIGWAITAFLLLAWTIFEAAKHGGLAIPLAVLGLALPDLTFLLGIGRPHRPGHLPRSMVTAYNAAHHPLVPLVPLIALSVLPGLPGDSAATFTFFLAWLAHIAVDRAAGFSRRNPDGSLPGR